MRYSNLSKLFTVEGMIVAAVVLILTLIICRPRHAKASSTLPAMNFNEPHSASWVVHFNDKRSPLELRCALERDHMAPFVPIMKDERLEYHATSKCNGLPCTFRLVFAAALGRSNDYALHFHMSWAHTPAASHDYYRKSAVSWQSFWCRDFNIHPAPSDERPNVRYQTLAEQAMKAEAHLADIPAMQQQILMALKGGASFSTAHKEGGTKLGYANGHYFRQDYGESDARETFVDEAAFLAALRKFYDWETSRNVAPAKVPDATAWRLILSLLNPT